MFRSWHLPLRGIWGPGSGGGRKRIVAPETAMLNPLFFFGFTAAQTMWEVQIKLLRMFTGAFDQLERAKEASKKQALERTGKGTAKRTMRLSSPAKRSRRKGR